jgi:hypothetical protein
LLNATSNIARRTKSPDLMILSNIRERSGVRN